MDTNEQKDFPGYPHYPANQDITRSENNNGKISIDGDAGDEPTPVPASDTDITPEEMDMLKSDMDGEDTNMVKNTSLDSTDDDGTPLNEVSGVFESTDDGLDVPGSNLDNKNEKLGEEDEENNYYSLGGNDENPEDVRED